MTENTLSVDNRCPSYIIWYCLALLLICKTTVSSSKTKYGSLADTDGVVQLFASPELMQRESRNLIFIRDVMREESIDTILLNPAKLRIVTAGKSTENDSHPGNAESPYTSYLVSRRNLKGEAPVESTTRNSFMDLSLEEKMNMNRKAVDPLEPFRLRRDDVVQQGKTLASDDLSSSFEPMHKPREPLTVNMDPNQEEKIRNRIRKNKIMRSIHKSIGSLTPLKGQMAGRDKHFTAENVPGLSEGLKHQWVYNPKSADDVSEQKRAAIKDQADSSPSENGSDVPITENIYMYVTAVSAFALTSLVFMMAIVLLCFLYSSKKSANSNAHRTTQWSISRDGVSRTRSKAMPSESYNFGPEPFQQKPPRDVPSGYLVPESDRNLMINTNTVSQTLRAKRNVNHKYSRDSLEKAIDKASNKCVKLNKVTAIKHEYMQSTKRNCPALLKLTLENRSSAVDTSLETLPSLPTVKSTSSRGPVSVSSD